MDSISNVRKVYFHFADLLSLIHTLLLPDLDYDFHLVPPMQTPLQLASAPADKVVFDLFVPKYCQIRPFKILSFMRVSRLQTYEVTKNLVYLDFYL